MNARRATSVCRWRAAVRISLSRRRHHRCPMTTRGREPIVANASNRGGCAPSSGTATDVADEDGRCRRLRRKGTAPLTAVALSGLERELCGKDRSEMSVCSEHL